MSKPASQTQQVTVEVCDHIVCMMDLLGQKDQLAKWSVMPTDDVLTPEMMEAIEASAGAVHWFRTNFEQYFYEVNKPTIPESLLQTLPDFRRAQYNRVRNLALHSHSFSDTFLFYAPLQTSKKENTILPLFGMLFACCWGMLTSLAAERPLRGGLALGVGLELPGHNFYGPALAEAYQLESRVADYPRVAVAGDVIARLEDARSITTYYPDDDFLQRASSRAADGCLQLLRRDVDNYWIVDYMSPFARQLFAHVCLPFDEYLAKARHFANEQRVRFARDGDSRKRDLYDKLCAYLQADAA